MGLEGDSPIIINLIGPPAVGKSTFAARFVVEHPEFTYISIDECRIEYEDESKAWDKFFQIIKDSPNTVMESVGLSWRLKSFFEELTEDVITISLTANSDVLHQRLDQRVKRTVPFQFGERDEHLAIDWTLEWIGTATYPIDITVDISDRDIEQTYSYISSFIIEKRMEYSLLKRS